MFLAAARRFAMLTLGVATATGLVALLLAAALHSSAGRAVSLGFYAVGSFALLAGVFVGSRGPIRVKSENLAGGMTQLPFFGNLANRELRWATLGEQYDAINNSAVFVAVGLVLLIVGILVDPTHKLF